MSGNVETDRSPALDRRARRTHKALFDAFARLIFARRRYEEIRVDDILDGADVGRSTFYAHYRGKDDLLIHSMSGMFDVLADAVVEPGSPDALIQLVEHFGQNREVARSLFAGRSNVDVVPRLVREVAQRIERRLADRVRQGGSAPTLPLELIATQVAEAQFALLRAWLRGDTPCTPDVIGRGLRLSSLGCAGALLRTRVELPPATAEKPPASPENAPGACGGPAPSPGLQRSER